MSSKTNKTTENPITATLDSFVKVSLQAELTSDRDAIRSHFLTIPEGSTFEKTWEATATKKKKSIFKAVTEAVTASASRLVAAKVVAEMPSERTLQRIVGKRLGFSMRKHAEATPAEEAAKLALRLATLCLENELDYGAITAAAMVEAEEEAEEGEE